MKKFDDLSQEDWRRFLDEGVGGGCSVNEVASALVTVLKSVDDKSCIEEDVNTVLCLIQGLLSVNG